jgi:signal peptide peptidase SppA
VPAIPSHSTATTDVPWDGPANEGRVKTPVEQTVARNLWAWREGGSTWPTTKSGFKFPHHQVGQSGVPGSANMKACSSIIGILNGARGGHTADDPKGIYAHAARHLKDGGNEPPPYGASAEDTEAWLREFEDKLELARAAEDDYPHVQSTYGGISDLEGVPPLLPLGHAAWAILPDVLPQLSAALSEGWLHAYARQVRAASAPWVARSARRDGKGVGSVAVVPLSGVLMPRPSLISMLFGGGGGGLESFREAFQGAVKSSNVGGIVLDVDSPGGLVSMIPETANEIHAARGAKPIVSVVNPMAASAAYWLAAQADKVVATPSGQAGSIGVYMVHLDRSANNEKIGLRPTYVSSGRFKTEGNPDAPLSEEAQAQWQGEADELHQMFVDQVAEGRRTTTADVAANYGEGRTLLATRAHSAGLVDRIGTLQDVVGELLGGDRATGARALYAETAEDPPPPDDDDLGEDEDEVEDGTEPGSVSEQRRLHARLLLR